MLSWIYFRVDYSFFTLANIHFIPEHAIETDSSLSSTNTTTSGSMPEVPLPSLPASDKGKKDPEQLNSQTEAQYSELFLFAEMQKRPSKKNHDVIHFGRLHFAYDGNKPVYIDMKMNRFNLDKAAGVGAVWLDLGGGMEPDDTNWEMGIYHMATLPRKTKFPGHQLPSLSSNSFKILKSDEEPRKPIIRRNTMAEADLADLRNKKPTKPVNYYNMGHGTNFPGNQLLEELNERISSLKESAREEPNFIIRKPVTRRYTVAEADLRNERHYYNMEPGTSFPGNQLLDELAGRISTINKQNAIKERNFVTSSQSYSNILRNNQPGDAGSSES